MPDIIDDNGNIWLHGREGCVIPLEAEDPALDASTWTIVFRTKGGFVKAFTAGALPKTLKLSITEDEADQFPLLTSTDTPEEGELYAIMDETVVPAAMVLQGYISRFGFE